MKIKQRLTSLLMVLTLAFSSVLLLAAPVHASGLALKNTSLRLLNRMSTSQTNSLRLVFQPATTGASSITINMNGNDGTPWGSANVNSTQTASSAACAADTGATAVPGTLAASGASGTISITGATSMTAGTNYCVDLTSTSAVTTPSSAGEFHPVITENSDTTTVAVRVVSNDQITVTATVPPTFSFSVGNVDSFTASLSAGSVSNTTGVTGSVATNAKNGWIAWAKDSNTGLLSTAASKTIAGTTAGSAATLSAGTEGYSMGVSGIVSGSGSSATPAAVSAYSGSNGGGIDGTFRQVITSAGTAGSGTQFTLKEYAAISSTTPAATDYTDTITVVGAASF